MLQAMPRGVRNTHGATMLVSVLMSAACREWHLQGEVGAVAVAAQAAPQAVHDGRRDGHALPLPASCQGKRAPSQKASKTQPAN